MCEPWGSFLVDARGGVFARDGVLSHSNLINHWVEDRLKKQLDEVTAAMRTAKETDPVKFHDHGYFSKQANRLFKPEYNWFDRKLDDFNRHDFEENATSRACDAVDHYVDENFGESKDFFKWLERGNYLQNYTNYYIRLFDPKVKSELILEPEKKVPAKRFKAKGCQHSILFERHRDPNTQTLVITGKCTERCLQKSSEVTDQQILDFGDQVIIPYETKKLEIKMRRTGWHWVNIPEKIVPAKLKDTLTFGEFADLWKKPENRIPAWQMN